MTSNVTVYFCRRPSVHVAIYRGYLLFQVNTKYISSNVMKISVNSRVPSKSEISDIFNT